MLNDKIKEFFNIYGGNSGLTEEFIYLNQPKDKNNDVKIYSSSTQENTSLKSIDKNAQLVKNNSCIKTFSGKGIIIARNGKAGSMLYINSTIFTLNDHAYVLKIKQKYEKDINIKYVLIKCKEQIEKCITSDKGGNRTFNKTLFEESYISIPDLNEQNIVVNEYEKYAKLYDILQAKINYINNIMNKIPNYKHGDTYSISQVFDMISEDRKLIEEYIYLNQGQYPVYSAQVEGAYGYIDTYSYDREILFVVQYGSSGKTYLRDGKLNVGRNVCGLIPNKDFEGKINLRFAKYALENVFIEVSKGTDLKSLSQTTINNTKVFIPDYDTQVLIANEYEKLELIKNNLQNVLIKINRVLN